MYFSLENLLGMSPEKCEAWSRVTAAHDGGFLILEVQVIEIFLYHDPAKQTKTLIKIKFRMSFNLFTPRVTF